MDTNTMKSKLSFTAMGIVFAIAVLGFAATGHLPAFHSRAGTSPVRIAEPTDAPPHRIYCFIGMKGELGSLYRGWVCVPEPVPTLAN
jgi:hypothetical protein